MDRGSPEELELARKQRIVARLAERLVNVEEEAAELREELRRFEARYTMQVGRLYAEQDELEAQIAEEELKLVPDDEEIKKRVEELRRLAEESAMRAKEAESKASDDWKPTLEAKRFYRELARQLHPDLAIDADEKARRHSLMAELNQAFSTGDQNVLRKMQEHLAISHETVTGNTIGDELVRSIRQIAQIRARFGELDKEKRETQDSELYILFLKDRDESIAGRDLLNQMAKRAKTHILKTQRRLENLRSVNESAKEYVRERFGLDISEFHEN